MLTPADGDCDPRRTRRLAVRRRPIRRFSTHRPRADDEDVHSFVERELVAIVGDAGRRLHTGRSRNEQVAVDLRLYMKRRVPLLQRAIVDLVDALLERATAAGDTLMPSYTHLRRAQPILVSHFFLAHVAALRRDHKRLAAVLDEVDELPLGSGAIAGASYDDRRRVPRLASRFLARRHATAWTPPASATSSHRFFTLARCAWCT